MYRWVGRPESHVHARRPECSWMVQVRLLGGSGGSAEARSGRACGQPPSPSSAKPRLLQPPPPTSSVLAA